MRLLLTALRCDKGDVATNLGRHRELVALAASADCDLVLLPEMSLTGSGPGTARPLDDPAVVELIAGSADGPAICFGLAETGAQRPTITQVVARDGRIALLHRKRGVAPDERDDYRIGEGSAPLALADTTVSLAVCAEIGLATAYGSGAAVVLGPAAPGLYGPRRRSAADWRRGYDWWRGQVLGDAREHLRPGSVLAVSTQAGATADEDFPGWSALVGPGGRVLAELPDGREGCLVVDC